MIDRPGDPLLAWVHVLSFTDRDAGAVHFVAKAEIKRAGVSFDAAALLDWYERVRRPLPWRATRDPYALLVSEVMLQQTQAARVVPYYRAFLARFPDPEALAAAPAADVLAAWSGLGYNRRALALQRAAREVCERGWPEDLTELPGRGRLHGGRGRLVRLGPPGRGRGHQRAPRDLPPRRRRPRAAGAGAAARRS